MAKMGRPPVEIDWKIFESLCYQQSTEIEIAQTFGVSLSTLSRHVKKQYSLTFEQVFAQKRAGGKASLRKWMFQKAKDGNVQMQIHLSKHYLGMHDRTENKSEVDQKNQGTLVHKWIIKQPDGTEVELKPEEVPTKLNDWYDQTE